MLEMLVDLQVSQEYCTHGNFRDKGTTVWTLQMQGAQIGKQILKTRYMIMTKCPITLLLVHLKQVIKMQQH